MAALLPVLPGIYLLQNAGSNWWLCGVLLCGFGLCGEAFIAWRGCRLIKAANWISARGYERRGRYYLPPEYADSESAMLAEKRRAKGARASGD